MAPKTKKLDRKPTMADVARLAGVGTMTVSRVLNDSAAVSDKTAERVHRAIRILRYQPNEVARSLRAVNTKTIGVIVPYLYDAFFATCAHAISSVARKHGYSVILTTSDENPEQERRQTDLMLRRQVEGIVTIPVAGNEESYFEQAFASMPVVTLDRPAPGAHFDSVLVPNRAGAKMVVDHLIGHEHKRVAFFGLNRTLYTMKGRYAGYRDAMTGAGYDPEPYIDCESSEKTIELMRSLLGSTKPPTAVFAANNLTMRYVLHAFNVLGIEVPRPIALAGFDDFELADVLHPALTVLRQPVYQMGEVAADLLFQRIRGEGGTAEGHRVLLPVELVVRRSCGCHVRSPHAMSDGLLLPGEKQASSQK